jgi:NhaP-type Na+/H+ or K+/H+ antiporter
VSTASVLSVNYVELIRDFNDQ